MNFLDVDIGDSRSEWRTRFDSGALVTPNLPSADVPVDRMRVASVNNGARIDR